MTTVSIILKNETDTLKLGNLLATHSLRGDIFALNGDLGAGKTVFAQGFIKEKCNEVNNVTSPTYTLVQIYEDDVENNTEVWHFDLYRLEHQEDVWETGIEDAFHSAISLIEWPSKMQGYLPKDIINVNISIDENDDKKRNVELSTTSQRWQAILPAVAKDFS
ncbi:MAG: tRNA (adenosine(37)-N6)-threonylcarbamoyltransferase complex ATPase subunit type 1 TsaE [Alphaproteobacteria bacterium]|nr:tRNA (adenosine(37)-N6)-threonylcarbamoyltransferase complex ATPase subunit type 1 TsaE [Alphaproteobacteria bacterium]